MGENIPVIIEYIIDLLETLSLFSKTIDLVVCGMRSVGVFLVTLFCNE